MSITSKLGRNSCLEAIKRYENKPLGIVETKAKLLRSAYQYTQDPINGTIRNLYDTVLQYRCPHGQKFSNAQESYTANSIAVKNPPVIETYNVSCGWNQTWTPLNSNASSLPPCIGMYK